MDEIESMLEEINVIERTLAYYRHVQLHHRAVSLILLVCTMNLARIFYKTNGIQRTLQKVQGYDLLFIMYMVCLPNLVSKI